MAFGATPSLAARLQALAAPDTVVISDATAHLVQGYFDCVSLGEHLLPGATAPSRLYLVRGVSGAYGRLDVIMPQHLTPFVGREAELAVLRERAAQVQQGQGQVILLRGEAGIGKSRLVQVLTTELVADGFTTIEFRGSPYAQHTALHPVVEWLQRVVRCDGNTPVLACLERLAQLLQQTRLDCQEHLPLLASLLRLDLPEAPYPALLLTPQRQRQCTLDALVALVLACATRQLMLLIVEDLHWIDPTTLEWVGMLIDQGPTAPLLTLMTCRPTFASLWSARGHVTLLSVPRLATSQVTQIVQWLGGNQLSAAQLQHIVTQTDGVPLFAEEVTKFVLAAHRNQGEPSGPASAPAALQLPIPATLRDALMARLDQLGPAKGRAQLGATIGREFPYALLQAVTPLEKEPLSQDLTQLIETELLYQCGVGVTAVYLFKHVLIQEAAYASLLRRTRQQYHRHIAQVLETQFPETVATQPELLAHHYTEADCPEEAVPYWHRAGQQAMERSAHVEAIAHLRMGLTLLQTLPETPQRLQRDVDLHIALGASLLAAKGFAAPEVEQTYFRARQLCQSLNNPRQLFPVVRGLWHYYYIRAEYPTAHALGQQLLALAQEVQEASMLVAAHRALGTTVFQQGAVVVAHRHFTQGMALYDPQQHRVSVFLYGDDEGVLCHISAAWALWYLGYPEQALASSQEALTLAQQVAHPFSLVYALGLSALFHSFRHEMYAVQEYAEAAISLATEQGFPFWIAVGTMLHGWALAHQGRVEEGVEQLTQGLSLSRDGVRDHATVLSRTPR